MLPVVLCYVLGAVALAAVSYNFGKWCFKEDDKWERQAEAFLDLADFLHSYGLVDLPKILKWLAIKDLSSAVAEAQKYVILIKGAPAEVAKHFDGIFDRVLAAKLKSKESLAYLKAKIAEVEAATPTDTTVKSNAA